MQHDSIAISLTEQQFQTVSILLIMATAALLCVAIFSTWPKWSWNKRGR